MRLIFSLLVLVITLQSCDKKDAKPHESFVKNFYGTAVKLKNADTLEILDAHIKMKTQAGEVVFSSPLIPEANDVFEELDNSHYVQLDILSKKEFKPEADTMVFTYYRRGSDTIEWYFRGLIK